MDKVDHHSSTSTPFPDDARLPTISKADFKLWFKEAVIEWCNDVAREVGWWSLKGLGAFVVAGIFVLAFYGYMGVKK